jgi:hypothetical protein
MRNIEFQVELKIGMLFRNDYACSNTIIDLCDNGIMQKHYIHD